MGPAFLRACIAALVAAVGVSSAAAAGTSEDTDGEWMSALAAAAAHGREESAGNGTTTDLNAFVRANAAASKPSLEAVAQQIDTDGDTRYSLEELQAWMQLQWRRRFARVKAAVNVDPLETIEGTMKEIDTDNSGAISYAEFSNYTSKGGKGREWVQPDTIFKLADENHDSLVSYNEFVLLLHPELSKANMGYVHLLARKRMVELDADQDGHIDFTEFVLHHSQGAARVVAPDEHREGATAGLSEEAEASLQHTFDAQDRNGDRMLDMADVEGWIKREESPTDFIMDAQAIVGEAGSIADLAPHTSTLMEFVHQEL